MTDHILSNVAPSRPCRPAGFDFTLHLRRVCQDMAARLPELRHIDLDRVAVTFAQTRRPVQHGMYACLIPLRFEGGSPVTVRRGRRYRMQQLVAPSGREMLYILSFYLPRFLDLPFSEKMTTVVHELWHIGPRFDGDLRRFAGRCYAHSGSKERFDAHARRLAERWLRLSPPEALVEPLRYDFRALVARHGRVFGQKTPKPKLIPVA